MQNKFFTFIAPYLSSIDDGKFFRKPLSWLYSLIALVNLVVPFFVLVVFGRYFFRGGAIYFLGSVLVWLTIGGACWIGFQIWWNRKEKINLSSSTGDDFIATPAFAHFIQTLGEWIGTLIGFLGFMFGIFSIIALGDLIDYFSDFLGVGFINMGMFSVIIAPVYGFLIIIITRFLAEQIRALVTIANNTKK